MTTLNKTHEREELGKGHSKTSANSQRPSKQGQSNHDDHPQLLKQGHPQAPDQQTAASELIHRTMAQYGENPLYDTFPQPSGQSNPSPSSVAIQEAEKTIRRHRHMVTLSCVLIWLQIIGLVIAILAVSALCILLSTGVLFDVVDRVGDILSSPEGMEGMESSGRNANTWKVIFQGFKEMMQESPNGTQSQGYPTALQIYQENQYGNDTFNELDGIKLLFQLFSIFGVMLAVIVLLIALIGSLILLYIHYKGVSAYRDRNAGTMKNMFRVYLVFLAFNTFVGNYIGMGIYGYLTYATYKLKDALRRVTQPRN